MAYSTGGSSRSNGQMNREYAEADDASVLLRNPLDNVRDDGAIGNERQAANEVVTLLGHHAEDSLVSSITKPLRAATSPIVNDPERQFFEEVFFCSVLYECRQAIDQDAVPKNKPSGGRARQAMEKTERQAVTVDSTLSLERLGDATVDSSPQDSLTEEQLADLQNVIMDAAGASESAAVPAAVPTETDLNLKCVVASHTLEPPASSAPCVPPIEKKTRKPPKRKLVPDEIQSATTLRSSPPSGGIDTTVQPSEATDAQLQSSSSPGQPMPVAPASLQSSGGNPRPPKRPRKKPSSSEEGLEAVTSQLSTDSVDDLSTSSSTLAPSTSRRRRPPHNSRAARANSDDEDYEVSSGGRRRRPANNMRSARGAEDDTEETSSSSQASTPTAERRSTRQSAIRACERLHNTAQLLEEFERDAADLEAYYAYNRIIEPVVRLDDISDASDSEFENNPEMDCAISASLESLCRVEKQEPEEATEEAEDTECMKPEHRCIICFDAPSEKPVACAHCKQFLGCKVCVKRWYRTTNISDLNRRSPLSRGQSHINHRSCPLCRIKWQEKPEVIPYCMLSRKAMDAEDTVEVKEEVKSEQGCSSSPEACSISPTVVSPAEVKAEAEDEESGSSSSESTSASPPVESPDAKEPFYPPVLSELSQFIWTFTLCPSSDY